MAPYKEPCKAKHTPFSVSYVPSTPPLGENFPPFFSPLWVGLAGETGAFFKHGLQTALLLSSVAASFWIGPTFLAGKQSKHSGRFARAELTF